MKLSRFAYHAPTTLGELAEILVEKAGDAAVLAGGQSLIPMLAMRIGQIGHLVDLNRVDELRDLAQSNGTLTIRAGVSQRTVLTSPMVRAACPLLSEALPHVGLRETRSRGTVVGSLVHADPAAQLPAVVVALDGELVVRHGSNERITAVADFFVAPFITTKAPGEVVTELRLPVSHPHMGWAFEELERGPFPLVSVAAGIELDEDGLVKDARLAFSGIGPTPIRARTAESSLHGGQAGAVEILEAVELALADLDPPSDVLASASYRRRVAAELARTALVQAQARAGGCA